MHHEYWGLSESPFQTTVDLRRFYEGPTHEEALARLYFLIENRRRFAAMVGRPGVGKSMLFHVLGDQVQRTQRQLACVDLIGLQSDEFLWGLAVAFGLAPSESQSHRSLWRLVEDHLNGLKMAQMPMVILLDHIESAQEDCLTVLKRLYHLTTGAECWITFIVATQPSTGARHATLLAELADLHVEVTSLDRLETGRYVRQLLQRSGARREIFADAALDRIFEQTGGILREVNRLCDLALVAAMGEGREMIDADVIDAAAAELGLAARRNPGSARRGIPVPT